MPKRARPERIAEFKAHLDFCRSMKAFPEKNEGRRWNDFLPDGTSHFDRMTAEFEKLWSEGRAPSDIVSGTKQASADLLEMSRDLRPEVVKAADEFLVAAGALSLTEMRRRVWRVVPKVLARGRIRNIDEFYVVKNVLDDDGEDLPEDERARLDAMRFEFETGAATTRKTSAAKRTSRGRTPRATVLSMELKIATTELSKALGRSQTARVPSPSGWCEAYVVEWSDDNSQVMLEFDGGACGSGAVSAFGKAPGLQLRWLDPTTVEVQYAADVMMQRNASGKVIQCGGSHRRVRVVLKPV